MVWLWLLDVLTVTLWLCEPAFSVMFIVELGAGALELPEP